MDFDYTTLGIGAAVVAGAAIYLGKDQLPAFLNPLPNATKPLVKPQAPSVQPVLPSSTPVTFV